MPPSLLDRARTLARPADGHQIGRNTGRERSEESEISLPASASPAFAPLDDAITASVARAYDRAGILETIERCQARAALPGALPAERQAVTDWQRILGAKDAATGNEPVPFDDEGGRRDPPSPPALPALRPSRCRRPDPLPSLRAEPRAAVMVAMGRRCPACDDPRPRRRTDGT